MRSSTWPRTTSILAQAPLAQLLGHLNRVRDELCWLFNRFTFGRLAAIHTLINDRCENTSFFLKFLHLPLLPRAGERRMFMDEIPAVLKLFAVKLYANFKTHNRTTLLGLDNGFISDRIVHTLPC